MYKHILIPTDGSELSKKAIEHGVALAKSVNAQVTVVTVSTPFAVHPDVVTEPPESYGQRVATIAAQLFTVFTVDPDMVTDKPERYEQRMATIAAQDLAVAQNIAIASAVPCDQVHVEHQHPYQAIIDIAKNRGCDLIVMASHGRRGIAAVVLGSETVKVLTHSTTPVLVFR